MSNDYEKYCKYKSKYLALVAQQQMGQPLGNHFGGSIENSFSEETFSNDKFFDELFQTEMGGGSLENSFDDDMDGGFFFGLFDSQSSDSEGGGNPFKKNKTEDGPRKEEYYVSEKKLTLDIMHQLTTEQLSLPQIMYKFGIGVTEFKLNKNYETILRKIGAHKKNIKELSETSSDKIKGKFTKSASKVGTTMSSLKTGTMDKVSNVGKSAKNVTGKTIHGVGSIGTKFGKAVTKRSEHIEKYGTDMQKGGDRFYNVRPELDILLVITIKKGVPYLTEIIKRTNEESHILLPGKHSQLQEEHRKLQEEHQKLKEIHTKLHDKHKPQVPAKPQTNNDISPPSDLPAFLPMIHNTKSLQYCKIAIKNWFLDEKITDKNSFTKEKYDKLVGELNLISKDDINKCLKENEIPIPSS